VADPYLRFKSKRSSYRRHPERSSKRFSQQLTSVTHSAPGDQLLPPSELPPDFRLDRAPIKQSNVDFSPRYESRPRVRRDAALRPEAVTRDDSSPRVSATASVRFLIRRSTLRCSSRKPSTSRLTTAGFSSSRTPSIIASTTAGRRTSPPSLLRTAPSTHSIGSRTAFPQTDAPRLW
jgi:hypothetical protein